MHSRMLHDPPDKLIWELKGLVIPINRGTQFVNRGLAGLVSRIAWGCLFSTVWSVCKVINLLLQSYVAFLVALPQLLVGYLLVGVTSNFQDVFPLVSILCVGLLLVGFILWPISIIALRSSQSDEDHAHLRFHVEH